MPPIDENAAANSDSTERGAGRIGRKGDPRMHRAVAARLKNPELALSEALRIGGFMYPANEQPNSVDSESVTLAQRKNQLSRRIRVARRQSLQRDSGHDDGGGGANAVASDVDEAAAAVATTKAQITEQGIRSRKRHAAANKLAYADSDEGCLPIDSGLSDDDEINPHISHLDDDTNTRAKRPRVAKNHPDYAPLFVPPPSRGDTSNLAASVVATAAGGNSAGAIAQEHLHQQTQAHAHGHAQMPLPQHQHPQAHPHPQGLYGHHHRPSTMPPHAMAGSSGMTGMDMANPLLSFGLHGLSGFSNMGALGAAHGMFPGSSLFPPAGSNTAARPSAVAISSLASTAQKVGMSLEQLAMTMSSVPNLSKILTECSSSNQEALERRKKVAHGIYKLEVRSLYAKCMLAAGIDENACREDSSFHLQFALNAWQEEGNRLKQKIPRLEDTSISASIGDANPHAAAGHEHHHHHHNHHHDVDNEDDYSCSNAHAHKPHASHDHPCSEDGRHIHRLNGKCGHKAIIHQPKDGVAHIDFVIGDKVECYHGIDQLDGTSKAKSKWPSKYMCGELVSCAKNCKTSRGPENPPIESPVARPVEPRTIPMADIDLNDSEWNIDFSGAIDDSIVGLFRLGESDDLSAKIIDSDIGL